MYHWITIVSDKPIAALNTLWYALEQHPEKSISRITLFHEAGVKRHVNWFVRQSKILLTWGNKSMPEVTTEPYHPRDIDAFRSQVKKLLNHSKEKVMIDITSGRKAQSALLLLLGELYSGVVEHVFYNFLDDARYLNFPYPCLPPAVHKVVDMLEK